MLRTLVAFDTTSAKSNLKLIDFVRAYLASHGVTATLTPSPDGTKASLFATIGPEGEGGIGLSSHSDCVPVEGQTWSSDPFNLELRDGRLYGRGSCDMKGFLACVLASVPLFTARTLKEPIHIIVSYDEEVGCTGVRPLIARLGSDLPRPRIVIVGEPTNMTVIEAHKRIDSYLTTVTGREAHSSLPQLGVNAISIAAKLIEEIDRIAAALTAGEGATASIRPLPPCRSAPSRAARRGISCRRTVRSNGRCGAFRTQIPASRRSGSRPLPSRGCCRACAAWPIPRPSRRSIRAACRRSSPDRDPRRSRSRSRFPAPMPRRGLLWNGGWVVRRGGLPNGDLRTRQYRASPCGR